ncbi:YggT family protein [Alkalibacillus sp. S2W]|uniref:YggT family protein n=1 Tax=Alkalibacillus sp. S2W TaxID=3386553 RepID=UPI00398D2D1F
MKMMQYINQLINILVWIVQILLGLRIILKLFGASESAPFVEWIYQTSAPLLFPFEGIFPSKVLDGIYVIEFSAIFAVLVYTLVGHFLSSLVMSFSKRKNRPND